MEYNHNNNARLPPRPYLKRRSPEPEITFTPHHKTFVDNEGHLYITVKIMEILVNGTLIDPNCMTNVVT